MAFSLALLGASTYEAPIPASYDLLATEILTGTQASIVFDNLTSTYGADYQHLQIRMTSRDTKSDTTANFLLRINEVTTNSYAHHRLYASLSSLNGYASTSTSAIIAGVTTSANAPSSAFGSTVIDVLDFASTSKTTTTRSFSGAVAANNYLVFSSGLYNSTDAVASVTILGESSNSFVAGSRFSLYGIRKAA
jgi:hypothetical protein